MRAVFFAVLLAAGGMTVRGEPNHAPPWQVTITKADLEAMQGEITAVEGGWVVPVTPSSFQFVVDPEHAAKPIR